MKNRLTDLNDHIFVSLERLNDEDLTAEEIAAEAVRAKAVAELATQALETGKLALSAARFARDLGDASVALPDMLAPAPALPDARTNGGGR